MSKTVPEPLVALAKRELQRKKDKGDIVARITLDHIHAQDSRIAQLEARVGVLEGLVQAVVDEANASNMFTLEDGEPTDETLVPLTDGFIETMEAALAGKAAP